MGEKMAIAAGRRGDGTHPPKKREGTYQGHSWDPLFQKASGKANLQCCGEPGDNPQFSDKIGSRQPCNDGHDGGMDWGTAHDICLSRGKRLCTAAEAMTDEGDGSGCEFDSHFVWTSTSTNDYADTAKLQEAMNKVWDLYAVGGKEYPAAEGGCSDVDGGSGWLDDAKPYTPKQCNDACKHKYPYFTIASEDQNCKCHPSCSSAHHGHTAYKSSMEEPPSKWMSARTGRSYNKDGTRFKQWGARAHNAFNLVANLQCCPNDAPTAIGVKEYPEADGGCSDVDGGSGWLTDAKPYTPEQCNDACKHKYPYFTIASGDQNCKCHPSCSSAHHGHTAYKSYKPPVADRKPFEGCNKDKSGHVWDGGMTWITANSICKDAGQRLCTDAEVLSEIGGYTGCNFDNKNVWTSTKWDEVPEADRASS